MLPKIGNPFGAHRVLEPKGVLPQPALKINNDMSFIYDNEILVDVDILNVDSASFTQIKTEAKGDKQKIKNMILAIVAERGKMQNPVTGSGGMFIGTVNNVGSRLQQKTQLSKGDKIASLVSLSLTPLRIDEILEIKENIDQVCIRGQAILFETGLYVKLPQDIPAALALAVLDVAGAPAQTVRLVKPGNTVVILGAGGKSGVLCAYEAKKQAGANGQIIGIEYSDEGCAQLRELGFCHHVIKKDATNALECYEAIAELTNAKMADIVINCVNINNTEMASILMCKEGGTVYFFSMATSFTKAALGAEGVGRDINMIVGNGYARGHAELALNILRESPTIRKIYENLYQG